MPRVTLTERFDWRIPGKRAMMSWPPGEHLLTTPQAAAARAAGLVVARSPTHEDAGTAYDPDAVGYERVGRNAN